MDDRPPQRRIELLKTLVGSHAHGLAVEGSDYDYRSVFAVPTEDLLSIWSPAKYNSWSESPDVDDSGYEIKHFLSLALKCNPSILEVFKAPTRIHYHTESQNMRSSNPSGYDVTMAPSELGIKIQDVFPYIWNPTDVCKAFGGYSHNQQVKFLKFEDMSELRRWKFAVAYIRSLIQACELLKTGSFDLKIQTNYDFFRGMDFCAFLREVKKGTVPAGRVLNIAEVLDNIMKDLSVSGPYRDKKADPDTVNGLLLHIRDVLLYSKETSWETLKR